MSVDTSNCPGCRLLRAEIKRLGIELSEARIVASQLFCEVLALQERFDDSHGRESHINGVALLLEEDHPWLTEIEAADAAEGK